MSEEKEKFSDDGKGTEEHVNGLAYSNNPYLLGHMYNPVNWRMWEEETFAYARREEKPLFISIGYSTCHWCHVMARESFEDEKVAELLNRGFVPVKIDREERPEVDAFYMDVALKLNGQGGWPLTIIATPEGKPFFAATYIPKHGMGGRAGMLELLPEVERLWKEERQRVRASADSIISALRPEEVQADENETSALPLPQVHLADVYADLRDRYDSRWGGFGSAPKFPQTPLLTFLLHNITNLEEGGEALRMVLHSLSQMRAGGIYDHIGLGFHRYATDRQWRVPHFEKMLYDQALLVPVYLDAFQAGGDRLCGETARETIRFVLAELAAPKGGFYSALDAESEGEEGKYYLWSRDEFIELLENRNTSINKEAVADFFHLRSDGNWRDPVSGEEQRSNILYTEAGRSAFSEFANWEDIREELYRQRSLRVPPARDDKVLTNWNGLMIAALARAGRVLREPEYTSRAAGAAQFLLSFMRSDDGSLFHRYRRGEAAVEGNLEDYAFFISGLIELYSAGFDPSYLQEALGLVGTVLDRFEDKEKGGYFLSHREGASSLPLQTKSLYEGALPSAVSKMIENLLLLFRVSGETEFRDSALRAAAAHRREIEAAPMACSGIISAVDNLLRGYDFEVVIAGDGAEADKMVEYLRSLFLPKGFVLRKTTGTAEQLARIAPHTEYHRPDTHSGASAYICKNFACEQPVFTAKALSTRLPTKGGAQ
ncbi:MAG: thioredoxin domain-containing protein [Spirochaetia bacterium]|nr:thioredoxin domain-containing protein [Spirochaetia bacterium]